jgi:hypothetical protein
MRDVRKNLATWIGRCVVFVAVLLAAPGFEGKLTAVEKKTKAAPSDPSPPTVIQAPKGCFVPDVLMDAKGVLHMVYALNHHAWYVRSSDNGATFTSPVKVNTEGQVTFTMGERGPKLALGVDGAIHVAWQDLWSPGAKVFARHSRSRDGGMTFEPPKAVASNPGADGVSIAADDKGNVLVFWHAAYPPQKEVPQATWLYLARSQDGGATFLPDEHVKVTNQSELACSMCMTRARIGPDGKVYLAFRGAEKSIRDFYMLRGLATENKFTAIRVNEDQWETPFCPMCGPELTFATDGRALCAFMTRHKVYWSVSDTELSKFQSHVATPSNEKDEIYPTVVANRRGDCLFVWQVGPMSTTGRATVKWAIYRRGGKITGQQGTLGTTTSGTKPTAFVDTNDEFRIVTTAEHR